MLGATWLWDCVSVRFGYCGARSLYQEDGQRSQCCRGKYTWASSVCMRRMCISPESIFKTFFNCFIFPLNSCYIRYKVNTFTSGKITKMKQTSQNPLFVHDQFPSLSIQYIYLVSHERVLVSIISCDPVLEPCTTCWLTQALFKCVESFNRYSTYILPKK